MKGSRLGVAVVAVASFAACRDYETEDPPIVAVADAGSDASEATTLDAGAPCPSSQPDQRGCSCQLAGDVRACALGLIGETSACKAGTQACVDEGAGVLRWSACAGAVGPAPEACNGVDDDCDGVVDEGCACSEELDLCKMPDGRVRPDGRYIVTSPSPATSTGAFDIIVYAKEPIPDLTLLVGSACYGPGSRRACASAGAGCGGWQAARFAELRATPGSLKVRFNLVVDGTSPCDASAATWAEDSIVVDP